MQRTKFLMRPVRQQQTLVPRGVAQLGTPVLQRRLMRQMQDFAEDNIIPKLQAEYQRNPPTEHYKRTHRLHDNWRVNVNLSHSAIAAVFTNNARDDTGRYYWAFVQGPWQPTSDENAKLERWRTVEQILVREREDIRDRAQRVFSDLIGA